LIPRLETTTDFGDEPGFDNNVELLTGEMIGSKRFTLCIHERDFDPGTEILDNIWKKMERSRKVILVISEAFVQSNYCNYELNLARIQGVQQGRNLFVPVMLQAVDIESMSDGLRWIVRRLTYLEWPREEHRLVDREEFWEKLRDCLNDLGLTNNNRVDSH
jgi:TIR domain